MEGKKYLHISKSTAMQRIHIYPFKIYGDYMNKLTPIYTDLWCNEQYLFVIHSQCCFDYSMLNYTSIHHGLLVFQSPTRLYYYNVHGGRCSGKHCFHHSVCEPQVCLLKEWETNHHSHPQLQCVHW